MRKGRGRGHPRATNKGKLKRKWKDGRGAFGKRGRKRR